MTAARRLWGPRLGPVPLRAGLGLVALALAWLVAMPAPVRAAVVRTIVVRGKVVKPDGTPASTAQVLVRGSATMTAHTDDRGHYSLTIPLGTPGSLARGPFTLEVRAEIEGRKLPFAAGGSALTIDVRMLPGGGRARVRSNSGVATTAIVTALEQDAAPTAWIDADFGGAGNSTGIAEAKAVDDAVFGAGDAGPRAAPVPRISDTTLAPPVPVLHRAAPRAAAPAPVPPAAAAADSARLARALARERAAAERRVRHSADSLAKARERAAHVANEEREAQRATARRDSLRHARDEKAAADSVAKATAPVTARASKPTRAKPAPHEPAKRAPAPHASAPADTSSVPSPGAGTNTRVTPPASSAAEAPSESCACTIRGTVEIAWEERPEERGFPVALTLRGPATRHDEVEMDMGPPREFRFESLPCGDYELVVRPEGRLRYGLVRGDSVMTVSCRGTRQLRVRLEPRR